MSPILHQFLQSVGQFLATVATGLLIYKDWSELQKVGLANALFQPCLQGFLVALAVFGIAKAFKPGNGDK